MNVEEFNIPRFLAVLPLFSDLSPDELNGVAQGCQMHRLVRGDTVFRFGEPCEEFRGCERPGQAVCHSSAGQGK